MVVPYDILHTEPLHWLKQDPYNYGSVVGYMLPDRLHEPFSCLQGNGRWSGTLWKMFWVLLEVPYDCNGSVSGVWVALSAWDMKCTQSPSCVTVIDFWILNVCIWTRTLSQSVNGLNVAHTCAGIPPMVFLTGTLCSSRPTISLSCSITSMKIQATVNHTCIAYQRIRSALSGYCHFAHAWSCNGLPDLHVIPSLLSVRFLFGTFLTESESMIADPANCSTFIIITVRIRRRCSFGDGASICGGGACFTPRLMI